MAQDTLSRTLEIAAEAAEVGAVTLAGGPIAGLITGVSPVIRSVIASNNQSDGASNSALSWAAVLFAILVLFFIVMWAAPKLLHETTGLVKAVVPRV